MELGKRIKEKRKALNLKQEELALRMFVSEEKIEKWENDEAYPDAQSLALLSKLFDIPTEQLVKDDVEVMKAVINVKEHKEVVFYGRIMLAGMVVVAVVAAPLFLWLGFLGIIPFVIVYSPVMLAAMKIEKIKTDRELSTYKEIVAFCNGECLDEETRKKELRRRPFHKVMMLVAVSFAVAAVSYFSCTIANRFFI